ncbi:hypothetical protein G7K_5693-t1 [Saitoella complicata NRRL Y-17804]|uniref:Uncharacterized protein n=2 Tax=Saitoella complicata (strain BCRC 22490 / CBS 7301 / JCM 7358 / NBRC 10748 / NRRL Y-17804) TaxID=698492 RepID=A0A0E9NP31_SAICN|nr:hypothetical protein G7K_5693-t1 [Saitoella complicata NRRL Y-17804]
MSNKLLLNPAPLPAHPTPSLTSAWRPQYHLAAPWGWMNDPCAPYYDEETGLYHVFYQWNPWGVEWGNMSWGHAWSKDLVRWENAKEPVLVPVKEGGGWDGEGVFTGCAIPRGGEEGVMTAAYTSVSALPIHYTLPYLRGCETLSIATSRDSGRTWVRDEGNPILMGPPEGVDVTGWRDPFVSEWGSMDRALGRGDGGGGFLYGIVCGGIRDVGPNLFAYSIPKGDVRDWTYLGTLMDDESLPVGEGLPDIGQNWEVCNFFELEGECFIIAGAEGSTTPSPPPSRSSSVNGDAEGGMPERPVRRALWISGSLVWTPAGHKWRTKAMGFLDHGLLYAANSFPDSRQNRRILWGWAPEDDCHPKRRVNEGFAGCLAVPRELFVKEVEGVSGTIGIWIGSDGKTRTLGVRPVKETEDLRCNAKLTKVRDVIVATGDSTKVAEARTRQWELDAKIVIGKGCGKVGVRICHTPDNAVGMDVVYDVEKGVLFVQRERSTSSPEGIITSPDIGQLTLSTAEDGAVEPLELRILFDGSVMEVYANERFALTTRVYHAERDVKAATAVSVFAEPAGMANGVHGDGEFEGSVKIGELNIWDGTGM